MKSYNVFIALAIVFMVRGADATQEAVPAEPSNTMLLDGKSASDRLANGITLQFQPVGLGVIGTNESLIALGYHITENDLLALEFGAGRSDFQWKWDGQVEDKKVLTGESVGVHYKRFFSDTFYLKTGLDYRGVKYQGDASADFVSVAGTSGVVSVLIGNQWQWQNFTLGCDWVGMGIPFASFVSSQYGADNDAIAAARNKYLEDIFAQGVRVYIGAIF